MNRVVIAFCCAGLALLFSACSQRKVNQGKTFPDGWTLDLSAQETLSDDVTQEVGQQDLWTLDADEDVWVDSVPADMREPDSQDLTADWAEPDVTTDPGWEVLPSGACSAQPASLFVQNRDASLPVPANRAPLLPDLDSPWQKNRLPGAVSHMDPLSPAVYQLKTPAGVSITMPSFPDDTMPLLVQPFDGQKRCYELPDKAVLMTESQAYDLYRALAQKTTGHPFNGAPGRRSVVGLRGSSGNVLIWNGNKPNLFDDTLVLMWREQDGTKRVLEFPAHTDTGVHDFGVDSSSSLWPNRHYPYKCGWHKNYNALAIQITSYRVRDDTNNNGHWDSDRNEWLDSPLGQPGPDYDRGGSAHNIHMGAIDGPLSSAIVDVWSAGCQVIPGIANWEVFIQNAWTELGDEVDYYLLDVRDLDPTVLNPCPQQDGSHECPFYVDELPYLYQGNTAEIGFGLWDQYNCSPANEAGPELVFVWRTQEGGTLRAALDDVANDAGPDIDVHLLMGDDPKACVARNDLTFDQWVPPGRYVIITDTYVDGGTPLAGPFEMSLDLVPTE